METLVIDIYGLLCFALCKVSIISFHVFGSNFDIVGNV